LSLLFFSPFVVGPARLRRLNVFTLAFLRAAADQNDKAFAILAEVNPVSRAEIDLVFEYAGSHAFGVREIPLLHTRKSDGNLGCGRRIESFEPDREESVPLFVNVATQFDDD